LSDQARRDVGCAGRGEWHDQTHRPRRIGLRPSEARQRRQRGSARSEMQKISAGKFQSEPPSHHSITSSAIANATIRERTCRAAARPHCYAKHTDHRDDAARDTHHPHRFRARCRSDRQRLRRELPAAGREVTGFVTMEPAVAGKRSSCSKRLRRASPG
jgi:hypothetical protein